MSNWIRTVIIALVSGVVVSVVTLIMENTSQSERNLKITVKKLRRVTDQQKIQMQSVKSALNSMPSRSFVKAKYNFMIYRLGELSKHEQMVEQRQHEQDQRIGKNHDQILVLKRAGKAGPHTP